MPYIHIQVTRLVERQLYSSALQLCQDSPDPERQLRELDQLQIHEQYAYYIYNNIHNTTIHSTSNTTSLNEYNEMINQFILAKTNVIQVILLFPQLIPLTLAQKWIPKTLKNGHNDGKKVMGHNYDQNVAKCMILYCEHYRQEVSALYTHLIPITRLCVCIYVYMCVNHYQHNTSITRLIL